LDETGNNGMPSITVKIAGQGCENKDNRFDVLFEGRTDEIKKGL
jgi:hypothetical protein